MSGFPVYLAKPEECTKKTKGVLVVDAKALYDAASNGEIQTSAFSIREKYTALELLAARTRRCDGATVTPSWQMG